MRIVIIRHGKVNYCWSNYCTSKEFDYECSEYNIASIKDGNFKIPNINYQKIYISELSRSRDTAKKIFAGSNYKKTIGPVLIQGRRCRYGFGILSEGFSGF